MGLLGRRNKRSRSKPPSSEFTNTPPLRTSQTQPPPPVPPVPPVPTLPPSSQREGTPSPFVGQPFESVGRNNGSFGSPGSTVGRGSAGQYQVGHGNSSVVQHSPERTRFGSVNGSFDEFGARDDRRRGSAQGQGGRNTIRQPPLPPQPPAHQQPGLPDNDISRQLNSFHFPRTSSPSHRGSSTSSLSSGSSSTTAAGTYPGSPLARIRKDSITLRKEAQRNAELRVSAPRARLPSRDLPDFSNTVSSPITSTGNPSNPLGPPLSFSIHTPIPPPQMKSFPFPQIKPLVRSLEHSLKNDGKRIRDYIEVEELVSGRLWDREDQEGLKDCGDGKKKKVFALQEAEKEWKERERQRRESISLLNLFWLFGFQVVGYVGADFCVD